MVKLILFAGILARGNRRWRWMKPSAKSDAATQINGGGSKQQAEGKGMRFHGAMRFKTMSFESSLFESVAVVSITFESIQCHSFRCNSI